MFKFKIGDIVRPSNSSEGSEHLICGYCEEVDECELLILKLHKNAPRRLVKEGNRETIHGEIVDSDGIFVRRATTAEMILYGGSNEDD